MSVKRSLLQHFQYIQSTLDDLYSDAYLNTKTFFLELHIGEQCITLYPQFTIETKDGRMYSDQYDYKNLVCFNGWRPYRVKGLSVFTDKLKFKELIAEKGLKSPDYKEINGCDFSSVIVKRRVSSFSESIKGPYTNANLHRIDEEKGEYFEKYIEGEVVKIWYIDSFPVAIEKFSLPYVEGNGEDTIEVLMESCFDHHDKKISLTDLERKNIEVLLDYHGRKITDVLPLAERQIVDFKYVNRYRDIEDVKIDDEFPENLRAQLNNIGEIVWPLAKPEAGKNFAYTIDAILDKEDVFWILEANSNPIIHPFIYPQMINSLLKPMALALVD
ncbi:MAG: hypothetical protein ACJA2B_001752 [Candidatus Endobugula sp.]|jgi:hypothetical protein